eukprot:jgi/Psemu1/263906/estExt_Genewise1Plus.C_12630002
MNVTPVPRRLSEQQQRQQQQQQQQQQQHQQRRPQGGSGSATAAAAVTPLHPSSSSAFSKPSPSPSQHALLIPKTPPPATTTPTPTPARVPARSAPPARPHPHPLAVALARRRLIRSGGDDEWRITRRLQQFTDRARQWESSNSLRVRCTHNYHHRYRYTDIAWIPLHGIRKALSARILNSFVEPAQKSRIAYTIWVYDVESGREWYAPIRYWDDFAELRGAALELLPNCPAPSFPKNQRFQTTTATATTKATATATATAMMLEEFLRELIGIIYTCDPLHPNTAEIALYVQSFLGIDDAGLDDSSSSSSNNDNSNNINLPFSYERTFRSPSERREDEAQQLLKRSIQRYSWRVFLLHTMKAIVRDFVDAARTRGPKLHEIESTTVMEESSLSRKKNTNTNTNTASVKTRAMNELLRVQQFLDQLVDLVLDGCNDDLRSIAERREYSAIHKYIVDESYWDRLVRESVREQVEIEVYVPLRSVISRLLVNGWRHDDAEVLFKIKELRKRPQGMFRIEKISPSHWQSVANILKQGVGMSTLPCVKLRAIVDAAREISQLHGKEHGDQKLLGADEFLPIFIFCVVRAEMERPCALSILLQNLCDRINRIGEIGYFLASFEAAIAHIKEIDLTEDREDMLSFLTVPLTEVSLSD